MFSWLKNTFNRMLFSLNVLACILLLGAYLAAWIPPSKFHWCSILAIGYPFLLLINILFSGWWLYRRKRYFYLSFLTIILGFQHFFSFVGFNFFASYDVPNSLQIMSYNVRYFNATALKEAAALQKAQQKVLQTIKKNPMDIFCGQEFSGKTGQHTQQAIHYLKNELGLKHHFLGGGSSLAIFSKYPILKKGTIDFKGSYNGAIYTDIAYQNQTIRVYCFHLQSIRLGNDEHEIFNKENLASLNENDTQAKYKRIGNKLKQAFYHREEQAKFIAEHIQNSPYPVLVCGDMNDTPLSYAYGQLSHKLQDAFIEKGGGFGSTYAGSLPFLRIDYTFVSTPWSVQSFRVLPETTSDHYPIYAELKL